MAQKKPKKQKQRSKKGKNRRKPKEEIARYWNLHHLPNMVRRHRRILRRFGHKEAQRFVSLHENGCSACKNILAARVAKSIS
jgi:hypothetical protein